MFDIAADLTVKPSNMVGCGVLPLTNGRETNEDFSPTEPIPDGYCERQLWGRKTSYAAKAERPVSASKAVSYCRYSRRRLLRQAPSHVQCYLPRNTTRASTAFTP